MTQGIIELPMMMLLGLLIGSFLNVCIYRVPLGESINLPRSHCIACGHVLGPLDLVPVFSYVLLGGKCRYCNIKISGQYPLIELINCVGYGLAIYWFGFNVEGIMACVFISLMLVLTMIDIRYMLLPTSVIRVGVIIGLALRMYESYRLQDSSFLLEGIIGSVVGYGLLWLIYYSSLILGKKEGMGYGDVRYMGLVGLYTSWHGVLFALFIGSLVGSIYGIVLLRRKKESEPFPLGPFLSIGAVLTLFLGNGILAWYLDLVGMT